MKPSELVKPFEKSNEENNQIRIFPVEITPSMLEELERQLKTEEVFQTEKVDYDKIKQFMELICQICSEPFVTFDESQKHFLDCHKRAAFWKCCNLQLETDYHILDHMKYHDDPEFYKCIVCQRCFMTSAKLRLHIRRAHLNQSNDFECTVCRKKFPSQRLFALHEKRHITLQCPHCNKIITAANYDKHIKFAHTTSEKVMCDICGKVSCDRKAYKLHYLVEHSGIDQKLQCDICGQW